jgi:hypothetical protein
MQARCAAFVISLLASCGMFVAPPPSGFPPPGPDQVPAVGVNYRVEVSCSIPIQLGKTWWAFEGSFKWPPPLPADQNVTPYPVPGVVRLSSPDSAIFRADVDGSQLALGRMATTPPGAGCL